MNYMNCDAVADVLSQDHDDLVVITNPSAQFFEYAMLSGVQDVSLDSDNNGIVDSTEEACDLDGDADGVLEATCGTAMDNNYGWTCRDLTATEAITLTGAADADNDGEDDGVWNVCEGLSGADAEAAGYGYCNNV